MDGLIEFFTHLNWAAVGQIIMIDILLGSDNAIVIALACRNLPPHLRRQGIFWGTSGAIGLRVVLIAFAVTILTMPFLKAAGGLLLLWIGAKMLLPGDGHSEEIEGSTKLFAAIKTIIVADFVMSLDNVIGIAAAAQNARDDHQIILVIFGLLVAVPFIVFGSQLILKMLDRYPIIIYLGAAVIGWIAGGMFVTDSFVAEHLPSLGTTYHTLSASIGAALVLIFGEGGKRYLLAKAAKKKS